MEEELEFSKYVAWFDSEVNYPQTQIPYKIGTLEFKYQQVRSAKQYN